MNQPRGDVPGEAATPWPLPAVGAAVQLLGGLLAVSIVLGRIYAESYSRKLGVPFESESNILSYAVVSPDLALACVVIIAASFVALAIRPAWLYSGLPDARLSPWVQGAIIPFLGLGILAWWFAVRSWPAGVSGLLIGVVWAAMALVAMIASRPHPASAVPATGGRRLWVLSGIWTKGLTPNGRLLIWPTTLIAITMMLLAVVAWATAELRAEHDYEQSPQAILLFRAGEVPPPVMDETDLDGRYSQPVRIVRATSDAYYVTTPRGGFPFQTKPAIYALPRASVVGVIHNYQCPCDVNR